MHHTIHLTKGLVSYQDKNPDKKQSILFVHGNSSSKEIFDKQMQSPVFENYRLLSMDLYGHGDSEVLENKDYSLNEFSVQIQEFILKLNLESVIVVGNSLGGHIAIRAANNFEKIKGLVIFATPPFSSTQDIPKGFLPNELAGIFFKSSSSNQEISDLKNELFQDNIEQNNSFVSTFLKTDPYVRSELAKDLANFSFNEIEAIESLPYNPMIINCLNDKFLNSEYLDSLNLKNLFTSKVFNINAAHFPQLTKPDEFNSLLSTYAKNIFKK